MDTKGQAEVWQLFSVAELILGLMILTFFLVFVLTYTSASNFNQEYLKEDLKLISLSLLASPEQARYQYPVNNAYEVSIGEKVEVNPSSRFTVFKDEHLLQFVSSPEQGLKVSRVEKSGV